MSRQGNSDDSALEVELIEITRKFGSVIAVDSVSLDVPRGEFLTLLGPSGCGKTTLLRMIAGFEYPDEGRVMLGGADVTDVPPFRRDVTTVFQHYALFPHLTVFDNVAFGLQRRRIAPDEIKKRVGETLEMVRLTGMDDRNPSELSGGQQQRVALARSLVLEPRVLLLDEPLAALDLKLRKQMQIELKGLQRRLGISFIYVTHDQEEALVMSDRVAVMNEGRIEQIGSAEEIYERPQTEFVAGFIGVSNILEGTVETSDDKVSIIRIADAKLEVRSCDASPGERVRVMIRPEKIVLSSNGSPGAIRGRVESAVYLGNTTQWRVIIESGQEIIVAEQNRASSHAINNRVGESVSLSWEPDSVKILRS